MVKCTLPHEKLFLGSVHLKTFPFRWRINILEQKGLVKPPPIPKKFKSFPVTVKANDRSTSLTHFQVMSQIVPSAVLVWFGIV